MTAPAAMPSVEDVARVIAQNPPNRSWEEHKDSMRLVRDHLPTARAILDLVAPILAEWREIANAQGQQRFANLLRADAAEARALAAEAALAAERERCAKIAEGASASFDYNEAMADCRDYDCGYNAARQSAAAAIRAQGE